MFSVMHALRIFYLLANHSPLRTGLPCDGDFFLYLANISPSHKTTLKGSTQGQVRENVCHLMILILLALNRVHHNFIQTSSMSNAFAMSLYRTIERRFSNGFFFALQMYVSRHSIQQPLYLDTLLSFLFSLSLPDPFPILLVASPSCSRSKPGSKLAPRDTVLSYLSSAAAILLSPFSLSGIRI